jgi:CheY-like chemotaxis protein
MEMTERILIVDDEPTILAVYRHQLESQFTIEVADSADAGLKLLENDGPFAVVVSDMHMPGMDGTEFLHIVQQRWPQSVRVMLTASDQQQVAVDAVNEGNIFRFLNKPCPAERLAKALDASLNQYRLILAEKDLLDNTLSGSISLLTVLLSVIMTLSFGRATRVKRIVEQLCGLTDVNAEWEVTLAAMLSQVGCVSLSGLTLEKLHAGKDLSEQEQVEFNKHPAFGGSLITKIPRLERVGALIAAQESPFAELNLKQDDAELLARAAFLKVALAYDRMTQSGMRPRVAVSKLLGQPDVYAPHIVALLQSLVYSKIEESQVDVSVAGLQVGMVLVKDVLDKGGRILVTRGQEISECLLHRLHERIVKIVEPVRVVEQKTKVDDSDPVAASCYPGPKNR